MTTKLEKEFFDAFDIQYEFCTDSPLNPCKFECDGCQYAEEKCPQITDHILLELICIDNQENIYKCRPLADNVEELKTYILEEFIRLSELGLFQRRQQVRELFKA